MVKNVRGRGRARKKKCVRPRTTCSRCFLFWPSANFVESAPYKFCARASHPTSCIVTTLPYSLVSEDQTSPKALLDQTFSASAMASDLDSVKDSDFHNVLQDIEDVVHHTAATSTKGRRGFRNNHATELDEAKRNLTEDMQRLVTSPHVQQEQSVLHPNKHVFGAYRALWTAIEHMKKTAPGDADWEARMEAVDDAVLRTVKALDPEHPITKEKIEAAYGKNKSEGKGKPSDHRGLFNPTNKPHRSSQAGTPQDPGFIRRAGRRRVG